MRLQIPILFLAVADGILAKRTKSEPTPAPTTTHAPKTKTYHLCDLSTSSRMTCSPTIIPLAEAASRANADLRALNLIVKSFRGVEDTALLTTSFSTCISGLKSAIAAVHASPKITTAQLAHLADNFPSLRGNARSLMEDLSRKRKQIKEAKLCAEANNATQTIAGQTAELLEGISGKVGRRVKGMVEPSLGDVKGIMAQREGLFSPQNCTNVGISEEKEEDQDEGEGEEEKTVAKPTRKPKATKTSKGKPAKTAQPSDDMDFEDDDDEDQEILVEVEDEGDEDEPEPRATKKPKTKGASKTHKSAPKEEQDDDEEEDDNPDKNIKGVQWHQSGHDKDVIEDVYVDKDGKRIEPGQSEKEKEMAASSPAPLHTLTSTTGHGARMVSPGGYAVVGTVVVSSLLWWW